MLQRWRSRGPLAAGVGLGVLLIGAVVLSTKYGNRLGQLSSQSQLQQIYAQNPKSAVLSLISLSPAQRTLQLQVIAQLPQSPDRNRARYLLAGDLIEQKQGEKALRALQGLEQDYPLLAPYVALKRAQAYEVSGNQAKASSAWQELLKRYPNQAVAAQALFVMGGKEPKYWEQAIAQFPSHPSTLEIIRSLLKQNPNQPKLILLLAKYAYDQPGIIPELDKLVSQSAIQLKPEDWEAIGFAYWKNQIYLEAGTAYAKAPRTPLNVYRTARSFQLSKKWAEAITTYQQLVHDFPNAKETGTALLHLAKIVQKKDALTYLDQPIKRFPDHVGEALVEKAEIFEILQNHKLAAETLQLLLTHYGDSDAAAEYRWKVVLTKAAIGDYQGAYLWAQPIPKRNPNSILAPRAGFWLGKWANYMGHQQDAKAAFEYVLTSFPQSYYAWRSATILGLDVGQFTTVGKLNPQVVVPLRPVLPAGPADLTELYQLGQDRDAWNLWQVEFQNRLKPTVAQQFTDGLMRLMRGENLRGISQISTLEERKTPEDLAQYRALRQQTAYWQALYPLPFFKEIKTWSQQRQLNPLLVSALIRQESGFEPENRSTAGALGLMQLIPPTAKWVAAKINLKQYNLENPQDNVQLGTWFLGYANQEYSNNAMLAVASYNAGLQNVAKWLRQPGKSDPDEFVEAIPFNETRNYVRQVFGNYWNYLRLYNPKISQQLASYLAAKPASPPR